jgi:hypothetical protein
MVDVLKLHTKPLKPKNKVTLYHKDDDGKFIKGHKPVFKGWALCTSTHLVRLRRLLNHQRGNSYKIYFSTANGATIISL